MDNAELKDLIDTMEENLGKRLDKIDNTLASWNSECRARHTCLDREVETIKGKQGIGHVIGVVWGGILAIALAVMEMFRR